MDILWAVLNMLLGLVGLVVGGELLVRGAVSLARILKISPLVIGLTVIAFGTSAPEMAVSASAARNNAADVALGNVVGSNIFNILFVLGLSALVAPLVVNSQLVRRELPLMVLSAVLMYLACLDGTFSFREGLTGMVLLVGWTVWLVIESRRSEQRLLDRALRESTEGVVDDKPLVPVWLALALALGGLALLLVGANRMVAGAVSVAHMLGVSELVIGLTIVAVGTSLPEVVASLMASLKGERDLAAGTIVGSNVFNTLGVMGLAGLVSPAPIPIGTQALGFDLPVMLAVSVACLPIFLSGRIARWEGGLFFAYYWLYVVYVFLDQTDSPYFTRFCWSMGLFVIPLTIATILVSAFGWWKKNRLRRENS